MNHGRRADLYAENRGPGITDAGLTFLEISGVSYQEPIVGLSPVPPTFPALSNTSIRKSWTLIKLSG